MRKTPILLRRGPMSGRVQALTSYRFVNEGRVLKVLGDGKHDVSGDFDALVLEELFAQDAPDIVGILDGVADGQLLTADEKAQVRVFRERLREICERHNARLDSSAPRKGRNDG